MRLVLCFENNLEHFWPAFAGNPHLPRFRIPRYAVQDIGVPQSVIGLQQALRVDHSGNGTRAGVNAGDGVGLPDIRPNFPVYPFELVEPAQRLARQGYLDSVYGWGWRAQVQSGEPAGAI